MGGEGLSLDSDLYNIYGCLSDTYIAWMALVESKLEL
jgi:hypothetical protein